MAAAINSLINSNGAITNPFGNDTIEFWAAGHITFTKGISDIYNQAWFYNWTKSHLFFDIPKPTTIWNYPPLTLILTTIFAPFHYWSAYFIWICLIFVSSVYILYKIKLPKIVIFIAIFSPASMLCIHHGQLGLPMGALFILGLVAIDFNSRKAGICLASLVFKPQDGLLGPIPLLARGHWRGLAFGAGWIAVLCAAVTLVWGPSIWSSYLDLGVPASHRYLIAPFPTNYEIGGTSVFWMARSLHASVTMAGVFQATSAMISCMFCWTAWRRPHADRVALIALTVFLTLLVSPYGFIDDMCGASIMVAWLAWQRRHIEAADILIWMWPVVCGSLSLHFNVEMTPCILALGAVRAWQQLDGDGVIGSHVYHDSQFQISR